MNTAADPPVLTSESIRAEGVMKRFGASPVLRDVTLRVAPGTVVALLGPSGCGKTTLLRTIAGLEVPDAGTVTVGDRVLTDGRAVVPPERRRIGMVFQDWALFPHLSVGRNVAYGLGRHERRSGRVEEALALVGLEGMADRAPATLSGGQQQRVALARALAPRPSLLLLDEPFSNLDTALRVEVRSEVHRLLTELGVTTVFVTHDQEEAFVLGDEVAVMREGAIAQQAPPADLYSHPADPWVARFVGDANLVPGAPERGGARTPVGWIPLDRGCPVPDGPLDVLIRPEDLALDPDGDAEVELVEFYGHDTVYDVHLADGTDLRARAGAAPRFRRGDRVAVGYAGAPTRAWSAGTGASGTAPLSDRVPVAPG